MEPNITPSGLCPVCSGNHRFVDSIPDLIPLAIMRCAEKLSSEVKSEKAFHIKTKEFLEYLDKNNISAPEVRKYLEDFSKIISRFDRTRKFFGTKALTEATKLKEKLLAKRVKDGEIKRPKLMCPMCYHFHFSSAEVQDSCWSKALKGDYSTTHEFDTFLRSNNYGKIEF